MITAVIINDSLAEREAFKMKLESVCPFVRVISGAPTGQEGLRSIEQHEPDLVFLNISLKKDAALDLVEHLSQQDRLFDIIFTTGETLFASACTLAMIAHLTLPADTQKLIDQVQKIVPGYQRPLQDLRLSFLLGILKNELEARQKMVLKDALESFRVVVIGEVITCRAQRDLSIFTMTDRTVLHGEIALIDYEATLLEQGFIRAHYEYLVNRSHMTALRQQGDELFLIMSEGSEVPVSPTREASIRACLP